MSRPIKKVNSRPRMRSSTSDGNLPSSGSRSFSQSASGSSGLDPETRGAKKRKSQHGEVYTSCEVCSEKDEKIKELTENLEHFKIGNQQKRQASELESMKARYHEMKRKYEAERDAKDNAILRLSKLTSSRLRDNNPNIADLSDQYRPTKLAEMYSEIYDNEWTDAFEGLDDVHLSEEDKINFLLELIMFVYKECKEMVERQLQTLVNMIVGNDFTDINCVPQEIKDIFKGIKDYRKSHAIDTINTIQKHIEETQHVKYLDIPRVKVYFEACVKLCWLAVHQDPPVVFDIQQDPSASFDHKRFQEYTKRGPFVEFVVWPAMLLHQNGTLLRKGVAQGAPSAGKLCHLI